MQNQQSGGGNSSSRRDWLKKAAVLGATAFTGPAVLSSPANSLTIAKSVQPSLA